MLGNQCSEGSTNDVEGIMSIVWYIQYGEAIHEHSGGRSVQWKGIMIDEGEFHD